MEGEADLRIGIENSQRMLIRPGTKRLLETIIEESKDEIDLAIAHLPIIPEGASPSPGVNSTLQATQTQEEPMS